MIVAYGAFARYVQMIILFTVQKRSIDTNVCRFND